MKTVGVDKDISIEEPIRFVLETKNSQDCLVQPYRIDSVTIYFVSREFYDPDSKHYELTYEDERTKNEYESARGVLCARKKDPVLAATTGPIVLEGLQTIDGIEVSEGDRVLVKNQSDERQNGIYTATEGEWTRSEDSKTLVKKAYVFVEEGVANIGSGWYLEGGSSVEVGSTQLKFVKFSENGHPSSPDQYSESIVSELKRMKSEASVSSHFYYKNATAVKVFGGNTDPRTGEFFPAWLNPDMVPTELKDSTAGNNIIHQVYEGDLPAVGKFELQWDPSGFREGDYFVCWSWRPTLSGETMSAHMYFSIGGGVGITSSIPTHRTDPKKYNMLMERYTPDTFKNLISESDLTPLVMKGLNESVAAGFTMLENLANQIIDLLDANATHEQLLPLLSNIFALKAKSTDPTLWRRQIKKAIPNFKRKGTIVGLREAFGDSGMRLLRLARLWQVASDYTFQEHFVYKDESSFVLSKQMLLPIDQDFFGLWFRPKGKEWRDVTPQASSLANFDGLSVDWLAPLSPGDSVRILYKTREIPPSRLSTEKYIHTLPLMDNRDESLQDYPLKNWNIRVVEEDDPMFGALVPVRHPIADPIRWGRIRTEFPYSENAYNMDEYNGSKRDSFNPCDIDKEFVDDCRGCQASVYNLDLEVEGLSDAGFSEVVQIAEEYMPFHAMIHTFNLSGSRTEFVGPVEERIEALITVSGGETVLAGEGQHIFNRVMDASQLDSVKRDMLSSLVPVSSPSGVGNWHGVLKNTRVCLYPSVSSSSDQINDPSFEGLTQGFDAFNINTEDPGQNPFDSGNLLEILGSSTKYHTISSIDSSSAEIYGSVDAQMVGPLFEYRVSNRVCDMTVDIEQTNRIVFSDENADFYLTGVVTQKDVDEGISTESVWTLKFEDKEYKILELLPDGTILLGDPTSIATVSGWELWSAVEKKSGGAGGVKSVQVLGLVTVKSTLAASVNSTVRVGDFLYLGWPSVTKSYRVKSFRGEQEKFYIEGYEGGDVGGVEAKLYRRVMESKIGQIGYDGLVLVSDENVESALAIGTDSTRLRENHLVFIGSDYYTISRIDGSNLTLGGRLDSYGKGGEEVDFTVYRLSKSSLSVEERVEPPVPGFDFDFVDRSGKALIRATSAEVGAEAFSSVLNSAKVGRPVDFASQEEEIDFTVEYRDGDQK